jgi:hypothetical protein
VIDYEHYDGKVHQASGNNEYQQFYNDYENDYLPNRYFSTSLKIPVRDPKEINIISEIVSQIKFLIKDLFFLSDFLMNYKFI